MSNFERDRCDECGLTHNAARRLAVLRRCEGMTRGEIRDAWPHLWPQTKAGERLLSRDLATLRRAA
jgi:hypothetical protein